MFLSTGARGYRPAFPKNATVSCFVQATAPIGWTRVTTFNDAAIRIVGSATPGSGGVNGFSTIMAQTGTGTGSTGTGTTGTGTSGAYTIAIADLPIHSHTYFTATLTGISGSQIGTIDSSVTVCGTSTSGATGGGGSHTHSVPGLSIPALSIPSLPVTMNMKFVDAIIAKRT